jgi:type I restriction enzyme S subunit
MEKQKNIPKLRFPEFEGEWDENHFGRLFSFKTTNSFSREQLTYDTGDVKNIHYGDVHTKFQTLFDIKNELVPYINSNIPLHKISEDNYCQEGDVIFADASEDLNDVGKSIEVINLDSQKVLSGLHTILARPKRNAFQVGFAGYLMKSSYVRTQIQKESQGTKVLSISSNRLSKISILFPTLPEQQKIASFFTAIDQKISQLKRKKTLLEQYKKGVMQKIFSQEIRFRDNNGQEFLKWETKTLGDITIFRNGKAHEQVISENGKYVVVNSKFISSEGAIKKYTDRQICPLEFGEIVMVMSDVPNGKALAKCFFIDKDGKYTLNQRICAFKTIGVESNFLMYILNRNPYFLMFDSGVGQTNLAKDEVLDCPLFLPKSIHEQTKIANFLSAIDNKIHYTQKQIEKAEVWKKGLMQQMFV